MCPARYGSKLAVSNYIWTTRIWGHHPNEDFLGQFLRNRAVMHQAIQMIQAVLIACFTRPTLAALMDIATIVTYWKPCDILGLYGNSQR